MPIASPKGLWNGAPLASIVITVAGCLPIPPVVVPLFEVPAISGVSCNATIVRREQFAGSAPSHFISLDKRTVAALEVGEFTTFPVSEGHHSIEVTWRVGDKLLGISGPGTGVGVVTWSSYTKLVELDCIPPASFFFTVTAKAFPWDESDRVVLKQVEQLGGNFALERNRYVSPGPRPEH